MSTSIGFDRARRYDLPAPPADSEPLFVEYAFELPDSLPPTRFGGSNPGSFWAIEASVRDDAEATIAEFAFSVVVEAEGKGLTESPFIDSGQPQTPAETLRDAGFVISRESDELQIRDRAAKPTKQIVGSAAVVVAIIAASTLAVFALRAFFGWAAALDPEDNFTAALAAQSGVLATVGGLVFDAVVIGGHARFLIERCATNHWTASPRALSRVRSLLWTSSSWRVPTAEVGRLCRGLGVGSRWSPRSHPVRLVARGERTAAESGRIEREVARYFDHRILDALRHVLETGISGRADEVIPR